MSSCCQIAMVNLDAYGGPGRKSYFCRMENKELTLLGTAMLTGKAWQVRKEYDLSYVPKAGEYVIKRYERTATGRTIGRSAPRLGRPVRGGASGAPGT